ncbi:MAG TPA: hypothetical protein VGW75_16575 [Solirubrobacteraceae bacterium]|jgi:hypothetical protein|nr:hypothetical protein [Solirubrobacteraceae bacterium]
MRRRAALAVAVLAAVLAGVALAPAEHRERAGAADDPLLRSGAKRYAAYLRSEAASLRAARRAGDVVAVRLHEGRLAPVGGRPPARVDPAGAVSAAARLLSLDARDPAARGLLTLEAHAAGAAVAFDAIRDALWARDKGLTGSLDERLANLRAELDRHRRGRGFRPAATLALADRRRLAAALDAYAWRLSLAARRVAGT